MFQPKSANTDLIITIWLRNAKRIKGNATRTTKPYIEGITTPKRAHQDILFRISNTIKWLWVLISTICSLLDCLVVVVVFVEWENGCSRNKTLNITRSRHNNKACNDIVLLFSSFVFHLAFMCLENIWLLAA